MNLHPISETLVDVTNLIDRSNRILSDLQNSREPICLWEENTMTARIAAVRNEFFRTSNAIERHFSELCKYVDKIKVNKNRVMCVLNNIKVIDQKASTYGTIFKGENVPLSFSGGSKITERIEKLFFNPIKTEISTDKT